MKKEENSSYLGDITSSSGCIDDTVEKRRQKGIGLVSQIMGRINNVSLGMHFFRISFILRNAMLVNGITTNAESWYNVKEAHLTVFEDIDLLLLRKILLRKIYNTSSKIAKEAMYVEGGILPVRYVIAKKKFMFLWAILNCGDYDLAKKFT